MTTTTLTPRAHDWAIPLTGRRLGARMTLAAPAAVLALGGLAVGLGRAPLGHALLSTGLPGLGQLVAGRTLVGVGFLVITLVLVGLTIMRSAGWTLLLLIPIAAIDAATHRPLVALATGTVAGISLAVGVGVSTELRRRRRTAAYLRHREDRRTTAAEPLRAHVRPVTPGPAPELDEHLRAYHRYVMGLGMSAPDDWSVFDDPKHMDQELRYQLALASFAIYQAQHQLTPAFRQHAGTALRNFAERGRAPRVWDYTRRMNLSALRWEGDPFRTENIMYSGYIANILAMYRAMTGAEDYDAPGSYTLVKGDERYAWSLPEVIDQLVLQHEISPMGSISCFPGSVWPPCQMFSLRAIQLADLCYGTNNASAVDRAVEAIVRYFVHDDGHIDTCRYTNGVRHPIDPIVVGITGQAGTAAWLHTVAPDVAQMVYERAITPRMRPQPDGRVLLDLGKLDTYDTSYGWNPGMPYSMALVLASEIGDTDMAAGLKRTLTEMLTPGEARPGPGSIASLALTYMGLTGSRRAMAANHRHVPAADTTPELESAPYPQVLVTTATTDGRGVTATVEPGPSPAAAVPLTFARLAGDRDHVVDVRGDRFVRRSTADGRVHIEIDGRTPAPVSVRPAAPGDRP